MTMLFEPLPATTILGAAIAVLGFLLMSEGIDDRW